MKKLFFLLSILLVFASCETSRYMLTTNYVNYSMVCNNKDFFITESNSVSFEYKALGSITVECISGNAAKAVDDMNVEYFYKTANIEDAYKELFKVAESKGANGVINLQSHFFSAYSIGNVTYQSRWIVTGMLIKK